MVKAVESSRRRQVWTCLPLLTRCVFVAVWVSLIVLVLSHSMPIAAATLDVPPEQVLEPGQQLQLPLVIRRGQGPRIEISLGASAQGASLVLDDDGQLQLEWQSGPDLPAETTIELRIRDVDNNEFLDSVDVVIRRSGTDALVEPAPGPLAAPPAAPPGSIAADNQQDREESSLEAPIFAVLPNQVVSAGRTVTLKVFASLSGEVEPVLQVDRLPRNASFEINEDGGRTFRWETGENDQGEHLFRFSAFNPRAPQQRSVQEVLMVVGDPTQKVTLPEPVPSD